MTPMPLSWLESVLLNILGSRNDALAGDLEELRYERSQIWFWRQLTWAILMTRAARSSTLPDGLRTVQDRSLAGSGTLEPLDPRMMNLRGAGVQSIGGLGLIAVVVLIGLTMPAAAWLVVVGLGGGIVLGVALVVIRRQLIRSSSGGGPTRLFESKSGAERAGMVILHQPPKRRVLLMMTLP